MPSKIWGWITGIFAASAAILFALFKVERSKRKEAELEASVYKDNAKEEKKSKQALDYAITERDKREKEDREHYKQSIAEIESYEDDILDDPIDDSIVELLNKNPSKNRKN